MIDVELFFDPKESTQVFIVDYNNKNVTQCYYCILMIMKLKIKIVKVDQLYSLFALVIQLFLVCKIGVFEVF